MLETAQQPSTPATAAALSPAVQQLVHSTIHTVKNNGEQLERILKSPNSDIEAGIAQAVKILEPLARDGVSLNDGPSSYGMGAGAATNGNGSQLPSKGYYQLWLQVVAELWFTASLQYRHSHHSARSCGIVRKNLRNLLLY